MREKSKERQSQEKFKIEEVDSVVSMSDVFKSTWKNGEKEKLGDLRMEHLQENEVEENNEDNNEFQRESVKSEEDNEEPLTTIAKVFIITKE